MIRSLACLLAVLLAGCATPPAAPTVQRVEVPVTVRCKITAPQPPDWAVDHLQPGQPLAVQARALRAERLQRMGYEQELQAAIKACQ